MKSLIQRKTAVLSNRLFLLGFVTLLAVVRPLLADEIVNVSDISGCRLIAAEAERLLCYDTIADGGVFNQQQLEQVQEENFGTTESRPAVSVDQLSVSIVKVQEGASRIHYFYTENGAVWKQTNGGSWKLKAPFRAEIKSGVMSSFFLVAEGGKSTRVKRVR